MHAEHVIGDPDGLGGRSRRVGWSVGIVAAAFAAVLIALAAGLVPSGPEPVLTQGRPAVAAADVEATPVASDPGPPGVDPDLPALPAEADAVVVQRALDNDEIFHEGTRFPLDAESVSCVYPRGSGMTLDPGSVGFTVGLPASDGALAEAVTTEHMAVACIGNGVVSSVELRAEAAVICAVDGAWVPEVTVLLDGRSCPEIDARPIDDGDLAVINQARAVEVRLLAVPSDDGCVTLEAAMEWARAHSQGLPTDLAVRAFDEGVPACYRPVTYWAAGEILVQALGPQPN